MPMVSTFWKSFSAGASTVSWFSCFLHCWTAHCNCFVKTVMLLWLWMQSPFVSMWAEISAADSQKHRLAMEARRITRRRPRRVISSIVWRCLCAGAQPVLSASGCLSFSASAFSCSSCCSKRWTPLVMALNRGVRVSIGLPWHSVM